MARRKKDAPPPLEADELPLICGDCGGKLRFGSVDGVAMEECSLCGPIVTRTRRPRPREISTDAIIRVMAAARLSIATIAERLSLTTSTVERVIARQETLD